jgi:hypothetical protein
MLVDFYLSRGENLYCCFIHFRKAFDSVDRIAIWQKLLKNNISGNVYFESKAYLILIYQLIVGTYINFV